MHEIGYDTVLFDQTWPDGLGIKATKSLVGIGIGFGMIL